MKPIKARTKGMYTTAEAEGLALEGTTLALDYRCCRINGVKTRAVFSFKRRSHTKENIQILAAIHTFSFIGS